MPASNPQRTPDRGTSSCRRWRSSALKANLRATGPRAQKSRKADASIRDSARTSSRLSAESRGLSCRRERSASRTRSRCPGCSGPLTRPRPGRMKPRSTARRSRCRDIARECRGFQAPIIGQQPNEQFAEALRPGDRGRATRGTGRSGQRYGGVAGRSFAAHCCWRCRAAANPAMWLARPRCRKVRVFGDLAAGGQHLLQLAGVAPEERSSGCRACTAVEWLVRGPTTAVSGSAARSTTVWARDEVARGERRDGGSGHAESATDQR